MSTPPTPVTVARVRTPFLPHPPINNTDTPRPPPNHLPTSRLAQLDREIHNVHTVINSLDPMGHGWHFIPAKPPTDDASIVTAWLRGTTVNDTNLYRGGLADALANLTLERRLLESEERLSDLMERRLSFDVHYVENTNELERLREEHAVFKSLLQKVQEEQEGQDGQVDQIRRDKKQVQADYANYRAEAKRKLDAVEKALAEEKSALKALQTEHGTVKADLKKFQDAQSKQTDREGRKIKALESEYQKQLDAERVKHRVVLAELKHMQSEQKKLEETYVNQLKPLREECARLKAGFQDQLDQIAELQVKKVAEEGQPSPPMVMNKSNGDKNHGDSGSEVSKKDPVKMESSALMSAIKNLESDHKEIVASLTSVLKAHSELHAELEVVRSDLTRMEEADTKAATAKARNEDSAAKGKTDLKKIMNTEATGSYTDLERTVGAISKNLTEELSKTKKSAVHETKDSGQEERMFVVDGNTVKEIVWKPTTGAATQHTKDTSNSSSSSSSFSVSSLGKESSTKIDGPATGGDISTSNSEQGVAGLSVSEAIKRKQAFKKAAVQTTIPPTR